MIKKATLAIIIATFSLNSNALTTTNLNSAISVMNLNQALTLKSPVTPYAGKDITANDMGSLRMPLLSTDKIIC